VGIEGNMVDELDVSVVSKVERVALNLNDGAIVVRWTPDDRSSECRLDIRGRRKSPSLGRVSLEPNLEARS
jgi:hypothetical protein